MVLYHLSRGDIGPPLNRIYSPSIVNLQGEKHVFFYGEKQLVPAGYVVNKVGLGGVGVGPQQNRNSHMTNACVFRGFLCGRANLRILMAPEHYANMIQCSLEAYLCVLNASPIRKHQKTV